MPTVVARAAAVVAAAVAVALLPVTAAHAAATVAIVSGGSGFVSGTVPVVVSATGDLGDQAVSIDLLVDGTLVNGSSQCTGPVTNPPTCTLSIPFDSSAYLGSHQLTAVFNQLIGTPTTSDPVSFTAEKVPVVSIDSPAASAPVNGAIDVAVSASTDAGDNDPPLSISLAVTPGGSSVGSPVSCSNPTSCSGTIHWNPSGLDGAATLTATVMTTNGLSHSVELPVLVESPTVAITAPVGGAVVSGNVQVTVHGVSTQTTADPFDTAELFVDGSSVDKVVCPATPGTCDLVLAWDAVAVASGKHTLSVRLTTQRKLVVTSSDVQVTVAPPPATVAISTPFTRSVVHGVTRVNITASTDPRALDHPRRVDLFVDGGLVFGRPCPATATPSACTVLLGWNTARLAGPHRITARVTTQAGGTEFSTRVYVWVRTGAVTRMSRLPVVPSGHTVTVRGRVVSTTTGHGLGGAPVRLTVVAGRRAYLVRVTTRSDGAFSVNVRTFVTTRLVSRSSASWLGLSVASVVQPVRAPILCRLSATSVRSGVSGSGLCTVRALPRGTPVALYYTTRGRTTLLASGAAGGTSIPFTYRFVPRGFYTLRVVVGTSANYIATRSQPLGVTVR